MIFLMSVVDRMKSYYHDKNMRVRIIFAIIILLVLGLLLFSPKAVLQSLSS
jgi:hypothetical protein